MIAINLLIRAKSSVSDVYRALTTNEGIAGWFTECQCTGWSQGAELVWQGDTRLRVSKLQPDRLVELQVIEGSGWEGSSIRFEIEDAGGVCKIRFDHEGWESAGDHFRDCAMSWAYFLESLRSYLETGKGTPESEAPPCESS